jgi:hypothetical protein
MVLWDRNLVANASLALLSKLHLPPPSQELVTGITGAAIKLGVLDAIRVMCTVYVLQKAPVRMLPLLLDALEERPMVSRNDYKNLILKADEGLPLPTNTDTLEALQLSVMCGALGARPDITIVTPSVRMAVNRSALLRFGSGIHTLFDMASQFHGQKSSFLSVLIFRVPP